MKKIRIDLKTIKICLTFLCKKDFFIYTRLEIVRFSSNFALTMVNDQ
jgi:hypothetical protein